MIVCVLYSNNASRSTNEILLRCYSAIYIGGTEGEGFQIMDKAMRARSICVSNPESENPSGGVKALDRAEESVGVPQSSSRPSGMDSSLSAMHVLHLLLIRLCWQMLAPPHSLQ